MFLFLFLGHMARRTTFNGKATLNFKMSYSSEERTKHQSCVSLMAFSNIATFSHSPLWCLTTLILLMLSSSTLPTVTLSQS